MLTPGYIHSLSILVHLIVLFSIFIVPHCYNTPFPYHLTISLPIHFIILTNLYLTNHLYVMRTPDHDFSIFKLVLIFISTQPDRSPIIGNLPWIISSGDPPVSCWWYYPLNLKHLIQNQSIAAVSRCHRSLHILFSLLFFSLPLSSTLVRFRNVNDRTLTLTPSPLPILSHIPVSTIQECRWAVQDHIHVYYSAAVGTSPTNYHKYDRMIYPQHFILKHLSILIRRYSKTTTPFINLPKNLFINLPF